MVFSSTNNLFACLIDCFTKARSYTLQVINNNYADGLISDKFRVSALHFFFLIFLLCPVAGSTDFFDFLKTKSLTQGSRFAFVPSTQDAIVVAIDTLDNTVADILKLPHVPGIIVVSDKLDLLLATDPDKNKVTAVYLGNKEVVKQLDIGMRPDAVLINPFDRYVAFGSREGNVSVWDMQTFKQMLRIDGLSSAENITFGIDGRNLYVVEEQDKKISVIEMHARKKVAEIKLGGPEVYSAKVSGMSRSADGYTGFVSVTSENRVVVIDLIDWKVKKSIPVGNAPIRPYSTADNRYILIPHSDDKSLVVLSALSHQMVATIPSHIKAGALNTGWLDTVAFIMPEEGNEIAVIDLDKLRHTGTIKLSGQPDNGFVTSDSKMLFTSIMDTGEVVVIDAHRQSLFKTISTPAKHLRGIEIAMSNNICH